MKWTAFVQRCAKIRSKEMKKVAIERVNLIYSISILFFCHSPVVSFVGFGHSSQPASRAVYCVSNEMYDFFPAWIFIWFTWFHFVFLVPHTRRTHIQWIIYQWTLGAKQQTRIHSFGIFVAHFTHYSMLAPSEAFSRQNLALACDAWAHLCLNIVA